MPMSDSQQGSHYFVMSLSAPTARGPLLADWSGTITPAPGQTRFDLERAIKAEMVRRTPDLARSNITFFAIEPNQL